MNVLALTILISVLLVAIFIICFVAELTRNKRRGIEHDSLLPLEDDESTPPKKLSQPTIK